MNILHIQCMRKWQTYWMFQYVYLILFVNQYKKQSFTTFLPFSGPALLEGRGKLIEKNNGTRAKLLARDGNEIDTMFVDRRGKTNTNNGHKVVSN